MKCIVPLARGGGFNKAANKTPYLLPIAGRPIIARLLDQIASLKLEEVIFILDNPHKALMSYIEENFSFSSRFIMQKQTKGSAHAILGAKKFVENDVLILFGDTFFQADLSLCEKTDEDALLWTADVSNPSELGVVHVGGKHVTKLIEKPDEPISSEALIGLYYVKSAPDLFEAIEFLIENNIKTKDSFHLTDAFQIMINKKKKFLAVKADDWIDADHDDGLFRLNALYLAKTQKNAGKTFNTTLIKPVFIERGAVVRDSIIGPNVCIEKGVTINRSVLSDAFVCEDATINGATLKESVIQRGAVVRGHPRKLRLAENAELGLE